MMLIIIWDLLDSPFKKNWLKKQLASFSSESIKSFQINILSQNLGFNLCGFHCFFIAHYLWQIQFAENISTFLLSKKNIFPFNYTVFH